MYELKPQNHNVRYNVNRNLWTISALATNKLQIWCLQKIYHVVFKTQFQLIFLPIACEVYSRNTYIPIQINK